MLRASDGTTCRCSASTLVIWCLAGATPCRVKSRTRTQPHMTDRAYDKSLRTVNCYPKARALKEADPPSALRAATSGSNCVALENSFHHSKSRQRSVEGDGHNRRKECDNHGVITPGRTQHQSARAFLAENHNRIDVKGSSPGAHEPTEDVEPARPSSR